MVAHLRTYLIRQVEKKFGFRNADLELSSGLTSFEQDKTAAPL